MAKKVLIVEDEETILELCSTIFKLEGYRVLCARDGEEALRITREHNPDIIVLDIQLPEINGNEVCKSLKSDPTMSHIKVLVLSGMAQDSDLQEAREAGADAYMTKPFSSIAIVEKVEELTKGSKPS
jgi:two-component system alkaline phosphatase synthesis response regulator PhoP